MAVDNMRLQVILDGIDKISKPLRAVKENAASASKEIALQKNELLSLNKQLADIRGYKKLADDSQDLSNSLTAAKQRLKDLTAQIIATQNPSKNLKQEFIAAQRSVKALEQSHNLNNRALAKAKQGLGDAGKNASTMARHEAQLKHAIQSTNASLDEQSKKLDHLRDRQLRIAQHKQTMHSMMMRGAAGYGMVQTASTSVQNMLAPSVTAFAQLEDAKTQLKVSLMNAKGEVGKDFEQIAALATKLGDRLPGTTSDFMNMMTMLKKQGMSSTAILGGLGEAAAYIGVQLKLPAEEAAEFTAKMQDATRTTEGDMMGLMDTIQRMSGIGVETDNMLQAFKTLSPAMDMVKRQGLDGARAFAPFIVMMDQAGMRGEQAGNAIRKVVQGSLNVDKIAKATEGTGVKFDFTNGKGEFGGIEKMMKELQKLKKLNTVQRLDIMKGIFGDDSETLQVLAKIIDQGQAGYDGVVAKMQAQADLQQRVNEQLGTLSALWEAATGTFTNTLAVFGEAISPELKSLSKWFGELSSKVGEFSKQHPSVVRGIAVVIVALTALIAIAGVVMMASAALTGGWAILKISALGLLSGIKMLITGLWTVGFTIARVGLMMLTNPIFLIIAAIAAAGYLIYKNWEPINAWWDALWEEIKHKPTAALERLGKLFINFSPLGLIYKGFQLLMSYLGIEMPATLYEAGSKLISSLIDGIKSNLPSLGGVMNWVKEKTGLGGVVSAGKQLTAGVAMGTMTAMPLAAPTMPIGGNGVLKAPAVAAQQTAAAPIAITVNPSAGMDEKLLAKEVQKQMSAAQQRDAAARRSKLSDKE